MKLLNRENGKFIVNEGTFANKPRLPKDEITLTVSKNALALLLVQLNLSNDAKKLAKNKGISEAFEEFFNISLKAFEQASQSETLTLRIKYKIIKRVVDYILGGLYSSLRYLKSLIQDGLNLADGTYKQPNTSGLNSYSNSEILPFIEGLDEKSTAQPNRLKKQ